MWMSQLGKGCWKGFAQISMQPYCVTRETPLLQIQQGERQVNGFSHWDIFFKILPTKRLFTYHWHYLRASILMDHVHLMRNFWASFGQEASNIVVPRFVYYGWSHRIASTDTGLRRSSSLPLTDSCSCLLVGIKWRVFSTPSLCFLTQ